IARQRRRFAETWSSPVDLTSTGGCTFPRGAATLAFRIRAPASKRSRTTNGRLLRRRSGRRRRGRRGRRVGELPVGIFLRAFQGRVAQPEARDLEGLVFGQAVDAADAAVGPL